MSLLIIARDVIETQARKTRKKLGKFLKTDFWHKKFEYTVTSSMKNNLEIVAYKIANQIAVKTPIENVSSTIFAIKGLLSLNVLK